MNTQVTETKTAPLVTFDKDQAWGAGSKVDSREIRIPKILLMQSNSDMVGRDELNLKQGDFVSSLTEEVVGSREESPIEFVVLDSFKTRQTWEQAAGDKDATYIKSEGWDPSFKNKDKYPWEGKELNGVLVTWREVRHYYVLLSSDIEGGAPFPFVISFKGMSMKASEDLATHLAMLDSLNAPSAAYTFSLSSLKSEKDDNKFWILNVKKVRNSTEDEVLAARKWFDTLQERADDVVVEDDSEETTPQETSNKKTVKDEDISF